MDCAELPSRWLSFFITQEGQLAQGTFPALLQRFVIMGWTGVDLFLCCPDF